MTGYTTQEVSALLDIPESRIRAYARAGFVSPARDERSGYLFSFQDLVLLRTAAELARAHVPQRRIMDTLMRLRAARPEDRPLSQLNIMAAGSEIVVRDEAEPPWNPESGQIHLDFEVREERSVSSLPRLPAPGDAGGMSAQDWFESGLELEAVDAGRARSAYEAALELEPGHADARINLGRMLQEAGDRDAAEAQYNLVLASGEHALAAYNLGVLLEDCGREDDAILAYERALAADPKLAEAHYNLARLHERRGDQHAAIRHFNGYRALVLRR